MSSGQYARYMDKSLDEMAAEMSYPTSGSPLHLGHTQTYGGEAPTYSSSKTTSGEEVYRDRATTRYAPFSGDTDSYPDGQEKADCTLFVSNLNYDTNWQRLKDHMKKGGSVGRCDVFKDVRGHSKGVGQCVFNDVESTERALQELNDTVLEGRRIKLRKALAPEHRDRELVGASFMRRKGKPLPDPARTVFVHNLDYTMTWQKLKDIFKVVGPVVDVEIMENHKGNARVQFNSTTDAIKAIALFHGQMLMDRPMRLRMDSKAPFQPDPLKLKLASLPSHSDYNLSPPRRHRTPSPELSYLSMSRDRSYGHTPSYYGDEVRGHDYRYRRELAEAAYMKEVTRDRNDFLYSRSRELDRRPPETILRSYDRRYGRSRSRSRDRREYGRMERSGELDDDDIKSVFVKNLPFQTSWQSLKDEFRKAGDVRRADVKTGHDGRSLGCGLVLFDTHKDAGNAIDMFNNKMFEGRQIEVRFDRMSQK